MHYLLIILLLSLLNANLLQPEDLDMLSKIHVLFEWEQEPNVDEYNLQISSSNNFNELLLDTTLNNLIFIDKNNLNWNNEYFWRDKPISGNWIDTNYFSISNSILNEEAYFTTEIYNTSLIEGNITFFGDWYDERSIAFDKYGKEIWNSGDYAHFIVHLGNYGELYGFKYPDDNNSDLYYGNNVPIKTNFNHEILNSYENTRLNRHDYRELPNKHVLLLEDHNILGPIPLGPWTQGFHNLGYEADGETLEFEWRYQKIIELDHNGNLAWHWDFSDYFDTNNYDVYGGTWENAMQRLYYDWTHSNSIFYDEQESAIYLSARHLSKIIKIDYPSGNIVWEMGLPQEFGTGNNNICTNLRFSWQHDFKKLENGNFLLFDNGNLSETVNNTEQKTSRIIEFDIINNSSCNIVNEYYLPIEHYSSIMGSVQLLDNNNYLINSRSGEESNHIFEINENGDIVWNTFIGNVFNHNYRAFRIPSIYPEAFSVIGNQFISESNNEIIEIVNNQISFTVYNHSDFNQEYTYQFTDLDNNMFSNMNDSFILEPNQNLTLSFNTLNNTQTESTNISLIIYPTYHEYAKKELLFNISYLNNNSTINDFSLKNIYPNPFNPITNISYDIPEISNVKISVYNLNGQLISNLENKIHKPGQYNITWNAENYSSGTYIVKMVAGDFIDRQKIILIK